METKPQTQEVVKPPSRQMSVAGLMSNPAFHAKIAAALPQHLKPERYLRIINNTILRTPKLAQCDANSFANALLLLSQYGLEPDGRRAHLIPFENKKAKRTEVQLIIDWKGLAELVLRSGTIAKLHADLICDKDEFAFDMGEILHHRINFREDRGAPYAVYALAQTKTGEKFVQVLSRGEVEQVRDGSSGWRAFKNGFTKSSPWQDTPGEMWKKTAFRRLTKWLPLSPELREAVESDDEDLPTTTVETSPRAAGSLVDVVPAFEMSQEPAESDDAPAESEAGLAPEPGALTASLPRVNPDPEETPQVQLHNLVCGAGFTFSDLQAFGEESGCLPDAGSLTGFRDIKTADAQRLLKAHKGLLDGLAKVKGAA